MNPRSEPLLWVQLIAVGAIPLEVLGLLLVLAGSDPGPLPQLERLLSWALGALAPAIVLWSRPADPRSLLLLRSRGEATPLQRQLLARQTERTPRLLFGLGVAALLPLLFWLDGQAVLASGLSPLQQSGRLSGLLVSAALLALIVWQWQQLVQALWLLLSAEPELVSSAPLDSEPLLHERTNLGLPLLRLAPFELAPFELAPFELAPLELANPVRRDTAATIAPVTSPVEPAEEPAEEPAHEQELEGKPELDPRLESQPEGEPDTQPSSPDQVPWVEAELIAEASEAVSDEADGLAIAEPEVWNDPERWSEPETSAGFVAVDPEQPTKEPQGTDLDEQIVGDDLTASS